MAMISVASDGAVLIAVKAVPGAKRDEVIGALGERLKVRVGQPAEGGKANTAICALLAKEFGVRASAVRVVRGMSSAEKVVRVEGVSAQSVGTRWAI